MVQEFIKIYNNKTQKKYTCTETTTTGKNMGVFSNISRDSLTCSSVC